MMMNHNDEILVALARADPPILALGSARGTIEAPEFLRGTAILFNVLMNIPLLDVTNFAVPGTPRLAGSQTVEQIAWWLLMVAIDGTQGGILQLLFRSGAAILLGRTMPPTGPTAVADSDACQPRWPMVFELEDVLGLISGGDIPLIEVAATLFVGLLRCLGPMAHRALAFLGFGSVVWSRSGWFGLPLLAFAVWLISIPLAQLWVNGWVIGPRDWARRSLASLPITLIRHRPIGPMSDPLPA